ncbi:MAG: 5-bromo-4-chloroindolyl phosphate hydrolysis family protein [Campylobacterota bacterium]|nr:5-bromo-4-chloroindolyl phosphate hydrolysis family protein [Campylobacterota bacterium]
MPSKKEFTSASRYTPDKQKKKFVSATPALSGSLFLLIGISYLSLSIQALAKAESFYFISILLIFSTYVIAFVLLRRGLALEKIYNDSKYAKAPKYPLKTIAGSLLALSTVYSASFGEYSFFPALMLGLSVIMGWYLYYGFDPRHDKIDGYDNSKSAERIMTLLVQAREDVDSIKKSAQELNSGEIQDAMNDTASAFEKMVKHIEEEPDDYDRARKYLVSYLGELKIMSETFVKLDKRGKSENMKVSFLETLHESILKLDSQYEKLLDDDMLSLDVKLSVMKQRLQNEE